MRKTERIARKSAAAAAVLNLVWPGVGYMYVWTTRLVALGCVVFLLDGVYSFYLYYTTGSFGTACLFAFPVNILTAAHAAIRVKAHNEEVARREREGTEPTPAMAASPAPPSLPATLVPPPPAQTVVAAPRATPSYFPPDFRPTPAGPAFSICPYCGKDLALPKPPKFCPFCKESLSA